MRKIDIKKCDKQTKVTHKPIKTKDECLTEAEKLRKEKQETASPITLLIDEDKIIDYFE